MNKKRMIGIIGIFIIAIVIIMTVVVINSNSNNSNKTNDKINVTIGVYDKENINIFTKQINTDKEYLIDVLKDINELKLVTEDSQYGEYITSVMEINQDEKYYWSYYINEDYATVGVSSCKVEEGKNYRLKLEEIKY